MVAFLFAKGLEEYFQETKKVKEKSDHSPRISDTTWPTLFQKVFLNG